MCGIAGVIDFSTSFKIDEELLRQMAAPMQFRGPDQEGYYTHSADSVSFGFSHKRLSIIDLSETGRQPMVSASGELVITYNGEIYNYRKIKAKLQSEGVSFKGNSDTEVILAGYQLWGIEKILDALEGMFAFALYDGNSNNFYLARDRFGEKPLYYYRTQNALAFSSDIRSFKPLNINLTLDEHAVGYFFSELCTPTEDSIYKEIKKLAPANYINLNKDGLEIRPYWNLSYKNKISISDFEAINQTETLLEDSVKLRLTSDVPVGCFLSGGLDSSLISLLAARNYGKKIKTISVGFEHETYNELPYAKQVAQLIESDHHEIIITAKDLNVVESLIEEFGEPFADSSAIPTYYVSKFAAESLKVVLGGDAGDEVFAGYKTYNQGFRMQQWHNARVFKKLVTVAGKIGYADKAAYLKGIMEMNPEVIATALYRNLGFSSVDLKKLLPVQNSYNAPALEHKTAILNAIDNCNDVFDVLLHSSIRTRLCNDYFVKTD
ncbi:asparagine synthase (glutamine-hydrolyzing), partial [Bacteroidota bacterium]